jgi:hypothetical protein
MKFFLIILAIVGLVYTFRTEESRKSFTAKFTSQKKVIAENQSKAYDIIPPLQSNKRIAYFNFNTNMANVDAGWWNSLPKEEKERMALLLAVYIASENKSNKLELRIFNGDNQLGTYNSYDGYKDYVAVNFDKFNK